MKTSRLSACVVATVGGYFWKPCPICKQEFGGQEWREIHGHSASIPSTLDNLWSGDGICPDCTAAGWGCYTRTRLGDQMCHSVKCEHVQRALRHLRGEATDD